MAAPANRKGDREKGASLSQKQRLEVRQRASTEQIASNRYSAPEMNFLVENYAIYANYVEGFDTALGLYNVYFRCKTHAVAKSDIISKDASTGMDWLVNLFKFILPPR